MTPQAWVLALSIAMATLPLPPSTAPMTPAPPGSPSTRYCLRVDPVTGSRMETVQCRTRYDWASLGVDVDQEWGQNGVKVIA